MDPRKGGPPQGIRSVTPALQSLGIETEVLTADPIDAEFGTPDCFTITSLGHSLGNWRYSHKLTGWLQRHIDRFDVVVIHGLWQYPGFATARFMQKKRKTAAKLLLFYIMPHGMLDPWFQREPSRRIKAWRNWVYWKLAERHTIASADGLWFTCQRELELAATAFKPYKPRATVNLGYGVASPPEENSGMRSALRELCPEVVVRPYLLYLSRLHPKKGTDLLIRAYAKVLSEAASGVNIPHLVIAGPMDSSFALSMKSLAGELGVLVSGRADSRSPGCVFPGMLQGDAKWGALYGCDAFVLPSHQENFGISVVEALACGKPVMISDQVNIHTDIVGTGVVHGVALNEIVEGLKTLIGSSSTARSEWSQAARDCYVSRFLPQSYASRISDYLNASRIELARR